LRGTDHLAFCLLLRRAWRLQRGQRRMDLRSSHERGERFIALRYVKLRS